MERGSMPLSANKWNIILCSDGILFYSHFLRKYPVLRRRPQRGNSHRYNINFCFRANLTWVYFLFPVREYSLQQCASVLYIALLLFENQSALRKERCWLACTLHHYMWITLKYYFSDQAHSETKESVYFIPVSVFPLFTERKKYIDNNWATLMSRMSE